MAVASTGTTLDLRASSLRDTRRGSVPCPGRGGWRSRRDIFRAVCLATGGAGPAGCGSGRPGIRGRGGSRRFSGGDAGRRGRDAGSGRDRFSEKGRMSCGVARQCTGSAGRATNCRAGVFASRVSRHGQAFTARGLCPPKAWADDPARLAGAHVPDGTGFATKPAIALSMVGRATGADVPFRRVAADRLCGVASIGKNPGRPERAVFPGRGPTAGSPRGAGRRPLPAPPRGSPGTCRRGRGGVCRRVTARKAGDCMTGSASNWPVRVSPEPGPVACRVAARSPRAISPFSRMVSRRHGHRETRRGGGAPLGDRGVFPDRQNRARPRPHRDTVVAWPAPSCFPGYARLCDDGHDPVPRQRDATAKKHSGQAPDPVPGPAPDPVVDAGNPPRLHPTRATADTPGACYRVVTLATGPPGRRTGIPSQSRSQL